LFVANRIFVDFGEAAMSTIVESAKNEKEDWVKFEMLYYLAQTRNINTAREALSLKCGFRRTPEYLHGLLVALTPGMLGAYDTRELRAKLEGLEASHHE
jgi:hypothetical protein